MFNALLRIDAALAATRPVWVGLGQLAVAVLGLHLAADRLDDHIYGLMVAVSGAVARVVVALGINAPEASAMLTPAAWAALIVELMVVLYMFDSLTFTAHRPELSWARFKEALSPHAVALPLFWLPAALAGAWVVGMAVEDALAPRDAMLGAIAGRGMGLLVAWRLSWSGFLRVLGGLSAPKRRSQGLLWAPVLLGLGTLAAWNGLPIWGVAAMSRAKTTAMEKAGVGRRGGLIDLILVGMVLLAAGSRTPLGGLAQWAWALATGSEAERPSLIATFDTGIVPHVVARIEASLGPTAVDVGTAPSEPYRSAALATLPAEVPAASLALVASVGEAPHLPLAILDHLHRGDPEATLEIYAIGEDLRARAIQRAAAAGEPDPSSYAVHRRYLPAAAARIADELVSGTLGAGAVLSLAWPIAGEHRISSPYGYRHHPVLNKRKFHNGVDMAVPVGTPKGPPSGARSRWLAEDDLNGRYVVIDHGYGVRSSHCHLSEHSIEKGDVVERAQQIGLSGNTGRSTGPHLHFTLRVGGETVDPEKFRPAAPAAS